MAKGGGGAGVQSRGYKSQNQKNVGGTFFESMKKGGVQFKF